MKIEDQVCSLELAKKLKELGVKQESFFFWKTDQGEPYLVAHNSRFMNSKGTIEAAAFTIAEFGEILGGQFDKLPSKHFDGMWKAHAPWLPQNGELLVQADTEADARAKMLVHLIENKFITARSLNGM